MSNIQTTTEYIEFLQYIKNKAKKAQVKAFVRANSTML